MPEKEADGAGFSLNLPHLGAGNRPVMCRMGSREDRDGSETAESKAGLNIL
jgi:hypothetical protein